MSRNRIWQQMFHVVQGVGNDAAMIDKLLTAAEVAVASMQDAPSNPVRGPPLIYPPTRHT